MNFNDIIHKKIFTVDELKKMIAIWRFLGKKIVFTNGCFDLIHNGHIHLLTAARSFGDVLIVGLNTDNSIRRLKPDRPLQDEQSRTMIMASFELVDGVILFDEDTPYELIREINPDVLVKGGDYRKEDVVGRDLVEARGGKVEVINYLEGFSTSNLISKMKENF